MLNRLIDDLNDNINLNNIYRYPYFDYLIKEIETAKENMIFLIGEPGSGKTFLLRYIKNEYPDNYVLIDNPLFYKDKLFELIKKTQNIGEKVILLDEAQLYDSNMLEHLRIFADKGNKLIFAMHKKESKKILSLPQFKSRYTKILEMYPLDYKSFENYVYTLLMRYGLMSIIDKKVLKKVFKYSKGNFRLSKKILFTMLKLLQYSLDNKKKYVSLDSCIFEMAIYELKRSE